MNHQEQTLEAYEADIKALAAAAAGAAAHPFVPAPVRELLPVLARVLQHQSSQIAELAGIVLEHAKQCACEQAGLMQTVTGGEVSAEQAAAVDDILVA